MLRELRELAPNTASATQKAKVLIDGNRLLRVVREQGLTHERIADIDEALKRSRLRWNNVGELVSLWRFIRSCIRDGITSVDDIRREHARIERIIQMSDIKADSAGRPIRQLPNRHSKVYHMREHVLSDAQVDNMSFCDYVMVANRCRTNGKFYEPKSLWVYEDAVGRFWCAAFDKEDNISTAYRIGKEKYNKMLPHLV